LDEQAEGGVTRVRTWQRVSEGPAGATIPRNFALRRLPDSTATGALAAVGGDRVAAMGIAGAGSPISTSSVAAQMIEARERNTPVRALDAAREK